MAKIPFRYLELLILPVSEVLQYLKEANLNLLIECKEYSEKFYALVAEHLRQYAIADRTIIFAFPEIAGGISLFGYFYYKGGVTITIDGIILVTVLLVFLILPLLGLGIKKRFNFKLFWGVFSLSNTFAKSYLTKFVIGVAYGDMDKQRLARQKGLYGITADFPLS